MKNTDRIDDKKELYTLVLARDDWDFSLNACNLYIENKTQNLYLWYSLFCTAISTYTRPFKKNNKGIALPERFSTFDDEKLLEIHDKAIKFRDKIVTHRDVEHTEITISIIKGAKKVITGEVVGDAPDMYQAGSKTYIYGDDSFDGLLKLIEFQHARLDLEIQDKLKELLKDNQSGMIKIKWGEWDKI